MEGKESGKISPAVTPARKASCINLTTIRCRHSVEMPAPALSNALSVSRRRPHALTARPCRLYQFCRCAELRPTSLLRLADLAISCPSRGANSGRATPALEMTHTKPRPDVVNQYPPAFHQGFGCGALLLDYGANSTTPFLQPFPPAFKTPLRRRKPLQITDNQVEDRKKCRRGT